jgi:hypothetical protein
MTSYLYESYINKLIFVLSPHLPTYIHKTYPLFNLSRLVGNDIVPPPPHTLFLTQLRHCLDLQNCTQKDLLKNIDFFCNLNT